MSRDAQLPPVAVIDQGKPSAARVYDCFLGGKDNYEVDRQVFRQINAVAPEMCQLARANRYWLLRVTRFLAGAAGIDQFLDLGAGLPTEENTHQAAQRMNRRARVVYVDNDPVVAARGRALLEENDRTRLVLADLTRPEEIFGDPAITSLLDLTRPVGLLHSATMPHVADSEDPWRIIGRYVELLPRGSYLALSHFHDPRDGGEGSLLATVLEDAFVNGAMGSGYFRTREEIERMFTGLHLVEPGVTQLGDWWPDGPQITGYRAADLVALGGVGRKSPTR
ncbi:SAM-dependent methyltransferase [Actinophytocola sediminis]